MRYVTTSGSGIDTGGPHCRPRFLCATGGVAAAFLPSAPGSVQLRAQASGGCRLPRPSDEPTRFGGAATKPKTIMVELPCGASRAVAGAVGCPRRGRALSDQAAVVLAAADALDVAGSGVLPELIELAGTPEHVITIADFAGSQRHGLRFSTGDSGRAIYALAQIGDLIASGRFTLGPA
jgi:hypothetical protein